MKISLKMHSSVEPVETPRFALLPSLGFYHNVSY